MENDRITLQVYDWNPSHEGFLSFLWNKFAINPETYQLLDCIARQTIMRIGGFKFDFDYVDSIRSDFKQHPSIALNHQQSIDALKPDKEHPASRRHFLIL